MQYWVKVHGSMFCFVSGTFLLFCGVCIVAAIFVLGFVPETKDKSLEEVEMLFMTEEVRKEALLSRQKKEEEATLIEQLAESEAAKFIEPSFTIAPTGSTSII